MNTSKIIRIVLGTLGLSLCLVYSQVHPLLAQGGEETGRTDTGKAPWTTNPLILGILPTSPILKDANGNLLANQDLCLSNKMMTDKGITIGGFTPNPCMYADESVAKGWANILGHGASVGTLPWATPYVSTVPVYEVVYNDANCGNANRVHSAGLMQTEFLIQMQSGKPAEKALDTVVNMVRGEDDYACKAAGIQKDNETILSGCTPGTSLMLKDDRGNLTIKSVCQKPVAPPIVTDLTFSIPVNGKVENVDLNKQGKPTAGVEWTVTCHTVNNALPAHGKLTPDTGNGSDHFTYTPDSNYSGDDTFRFLCAYREFYSATAMGKVTVHVTAASAGGAPTNQGTGTGDNGQPGSKVVFDGLGKVSTTGLLPPSKAASVPAPSLLDKVTKMLTGEKKDDACTARVTNLFVKACNRGPSSSELGEWEFQACQNGLSDEAIISLLTNSPQCVKAK